MRKCGVAVLAGVLALAGCGGGSDKAKTIEATTTTGAVTSTTEKRAPADIASALLTVGDFPTGWSEAPPDEDEEDDGSDCASDFDMDEQVPPKAKAERNFQESDMGPFVFHAVASYESTGQAKEVLRLFGDFLKKCQTFESTDEDGTKTTGTMSALSFPKLGDDTYALRMTFKQEEGFSGSGDVIVIREGDAVTLLFNFGIAGSADTELTESLSRKAAERL